MKNSASNMYVTVAFLLSACLLTGCGGSKVLKEPEPIVATQSLVMASNQTLSVTLDWVIVRDGAGTWARNADWDEYLLSIGNQSDQPVQVTGVFVVDSLETRLETMTDRGPLAKESKRTTRRYKEHGIEVTAGTGRGVMRVAGVTAGGAAIGVMAGAGGFFGPGFAAAAGGTLVLAPVLAVGGVVRGLNQGKVNKEIGQRQSVFPLKVPAHEELGIDVFFPIAPSPTVVELHYADAAGDHTIVIDTRAALDGLHIVSRSK